MLGPINDPSGLANIHGSRMALLVDLLPRSVLHPPHDWHRQIRRGAPEPAADPLKHGDLPPGHGILISRAVSRPQIACRWHWYEGGPARNSTGGGPDRCWWFLRQVPFFAEKKRRM